MASIEWIAVCKCWIVQDKQFWSGGGSGKGGALA
jgi:hypothetical protein